MILLNETCLKCGYTKDFEIDYNKYNRWKGGELLQNVMPELDENDRELLISNVCGKCFDKMFDSYDEELKENV